jgi:DNA-binding response OmpR family regulator
MTASARQEDLERCLAAGMDDYISKPVRGSDLLSVVSRWTGHGPAANGALLRGHGHASQVTTPTVSSP